VWWLAVVDAVHCRHFGSVRSEQLLPAPVARLPQVRAKYGDDWERIGRMSIIEDGPQGEK
jgi:hypothetical protein